jgi:hypothetical protein
VLRHVDSIFDGSLDVQLVPFLGKLDLLCNLLVGGKGKLLEDCSRERISRYNSPHDIRIILIHLFQDYPVIGLRRHPNYGMILRQLNCRSFIQTLEL